MTMTTIMAYGQLLRLPNALMAAAAAGLGFWLSGSTAGVSAGILVCIAAGAGAGFGNCINDLADVAEDTINRPRRPLPCGRVSIRGAWICSIGLGVAALGAGCVVSPWHGLGVAAPCMLLGIYTWRLKRTALVGNILVSILVGYALVFGGVTAPGVSRLFVPAVLATVINLIRELVKDVEDEPGDRAAGKHTSARLGYRTIKAVIVVCAVIFVPCALYGYSGEHFHRVYLFVLLAVVFPLHLLMSLLVLLSPFPRGVRAIAHLCKLELLAGLVAAGLDYWLMG
jgi:geranylgeranylglycerol-phosphate geranylgeranyltransferase